MNFFFFIIGIVGCSAIGLDNAGVKAAFDLQNSFRVTHKATPLKVSADCTTLAQSWADQLAATNILAHGNTFQNGKQYGQNIYVALGGKFNASNAIKKWYSEAAGYNYSSNMFSPAHGHFTAMVWKSTLNVGFGQAQMGTATYFVANYYPAGNFQGQFTNNVS